MGDEGFPQPITGPPTALQKLHTWFAAHKFGRLLEFLFWAVPGAIVTLVAYESIQRGWMATPLALILGLIGVSLIGFGALPQHKPPAPPPPNPKSLRAKRGK
ncbi:MAG: hypothetical protein ACYDCK_10380 [Thermoplasmatota archaeon]